MTLRALRRCSLLAVLAVLLGARPADLSLDFDPDALPAPVDEQAWARPLAAGGRLVVKVRDSVPGCLHCWHERGAAGAAGAGPGESLAALHSRFAVAAVEPLFRDAAEERRLGPGASGVDALRRHHRDRLLAARARSAARGRPVAPVAELPDLHHVYLLRLGPGADPETAAAAFRADPEVEYAHPDYLMRTDYTPDDPFFASSGSWDQEYPDLWALRPDRLVMEAAWDVSRGRGTVVAVVDTGIDWDHPDIARNVWRNEAEVPGNGVDDDGNGFVDDVRGWDFVECGELETIDRCRTPGSPGNDPMDDHGHGTHVAGTIAAIGGNARGIVGVAPGARVMPVKTFNRQGVGFSSETAPGLLYAGENGADVINNSWGCGFCPSVPVYIDTLRALHALGVVTVFAAGNSASDVRYRSPHNLHDPQPVVVAATMPDDRLAWFSSIGASVDVAAPGAGTRPSDPGILSLKSSEHRFRPELSVGGGYVRLQGTSMAAPHVSGLAALLLAQRPGLTPDQVRQILRTSADDVDGPGLDLRTGAGRIDAERALQVPSTLDVEIDQPLDLIAPGPAVSRLTVTGTAAGDDFERYQLLYREEYGDQWLPITAPATSEVRDGVLGHWELAGLPLGWKALRLAARTSGGLEFDDLVYVGRQIESQRVPDSPLRLNLEADVSGDLVVWTGDLAGDSFTGHVYLHDLATGRTRRLSHRLANPGPRISGNLVTWSDYHGGKSTIYACYYDPPTGACPIRRIATMPGQRGLSVSGDRIAWTQFELSTLPHLRVYDAARSAYIFSHRAAVDSDIDGDLVTWVHWPGAAGRKPIMLYDLGTGTRRQLTSGRERDLHPQVSGRSVVYSRAHVERDGVGFSLEHYDVDARRERTLIPTGAPVNVRISGDRVVWDHVADVLVYDLADDSLRAAVIKPFVVRDDASIDGDRLVWINVNHPRGGSGSIHTGVLP